MKSRVGWKVAIPIQNLAMFSLVQGVKNTLSMY